MHKMITALLNIGDALCSTSQTFSWRQSICHMTNSWHSQLVTESIRRSQVINGELTWCGPTANVECRSEMCSAQLAGNAGPKKLPKICYLHTIAQHCRAISSQIRNISTIGKKLVKQQCLPHMKLLTRDSRNSGCEFGQLNRRITHSEFQLSTTLLLTSASV